MKIEKRIIFNNKNQKLVGYFATHPTSDTLLIYCHGLWSVSELPQIRQGFEMLYDMGLSIFWFDFTGHGESEGERQFSHRQRVTEIGTILKHFEKRYKKIILEGVSAGAVSAAIAAIEYPQITQLLLINGVFELRGMSPFLFLKAPHVYLKFWWDAFFDNRVKEEAKYAYSHLKPELIKIPTLIEVGMQDKIVRPSQSLKFYRRLTAKKKLIIFPEGDHGLSNIKDIARHIDDVKKWWFQESTTN